MVYRAGSRHSYHVNARVHIRFSTDEGVNWTAENKFTNGNDVIGAPFAGDTNDLDMPLIVKAPNGNLLVIAGEKLEDPTVHNSSQWRSTDGGETWTDEGIVMSETKAMDTIVIGGTIYAAAFSTDGANEKSTLWKSADNGTTWIKVSDITTFAVDGISVNECSLCNPSGNILLVVMRHAQSTSTFMRSSTDLGVTWGAVQVIYNQVGIIQRPRLRMFAGSSHIYLIGRNSDSGPTNPLSTICYSDNAGANWKSKINLEDTFQNDCGYADGLKRANGNIYVASYRGTHDAATIYEYIVAVA